MSFTNYYFNYGFNSAMEKEAARKEKEDEGMGWGAKLGLGALGAAGLGAGAYYSPEILNALGQGDSALWAHQNLKAPMQEAGGYLADKAGEGVDAVKEQYDKYLGGPEGAVPFRPEAIGEQHMEQIDSMGDMARDLKGAAQDTPLAPGVSMEQAMGEVDTGAKAMAAHQASALANKMAVMEKIKAMQPINEPGGALSTLNEINKDPGGFAKGMYNTGKDAITGAHKAVQKALVPTAADVQMDPRLPMNGNLIQHR